VTNGPFFYHGSNFSRRFNGALFFGDFGIGFNREHPPMNTHAQQINAVAGLPKAQVKNVITGLPFTLVDLEEGN